MGKLKLAQERLKEVLDYNASTGIFIWKDRIRKNGTRDYHSGQVAGGFNGKRYWLININGEKHQAHRLAWLYIHGYLPEHQIDHINQIKHDNRIENLREATQSCNLQNRGIQKNNLSGIVGVNWRERDKKWYVRIAKNKKQIHIGVFISLFDAAKARYKAELKHFTCVVKSSAMDFIEAYKNKGG